MFKNYFDYVINKTAGNPALPLAFIMVFGLLLRTWGLDFGLPHKEVRPDESTVIYMALLHLKNGLEPASLAYPSFYIYILAGLYKILALVSGGTSELIRSFALEPERLYLINRGLAALFGTLLIVPVYKTAQLIFNERAAILAALFTAVCPLLVRDSHFGTLDIPAVFFIALSTYFTVKAYRTGRAADYVWAGAAAGLATGTKYIGILMFFQMAGTHLLVAREQHTGWKTLVKDPRPLWFALAFLLAFFVSTPYAFLAPAQLRQDYAFHTQLHGVMQGSTLWHHLTFSLRHALTLPVYLAAIAGMAALIFRQPKKAVLICGFFLAYLLVLNKVSSTFIRYIIPLLPVLCICAGYAIASITARLKNETAAVAAALVFTLAPLYFCLRQDTLLNRPDTRVIAAADFRAMVAQGASVGVLGTAYTTPQLPWDNTYLSVKIRQEQNGDNPLMAMVYGHMLDLNIETARPGYRRILYAESGFTEKPDIIIVPCGQFKAPSCDTAARDFSPEYELFHTIASGAKTGAVYDPTDAFYLPLNGKADFSGPDFIFLKRQGSVY